MASIETGFAVMFIQGDRLTKTLDRCGEIRRFSLYKSVTMPCRRSLRR